jgi:hypothetical protein
VLEIIEKETVSEVTLSEDHWVDVPEIIEKETVSEASLSEDHLLDVT